MTMSKLAMYFRWDAGHDFLPLQLSLPLLRDKSTVYNMERISNALSIFLGENWVEDLDRSLFISSCWYLELLGGGGEGGWHRLRKKHHLSCLKDRPFSLTDIYGSFSVNCPCYTFVYTFFFLSPASKLWVCTLKPSQIYHKGCYDKDLSVSITQFNCTVLLLLLFFKVDSD